MGDDTVEAGSVGPEPLKDPEREIDWFLPAVGLVGLGLVAWLVYIYWQ